ncbi:hypothetical protein [Streptomyces hygroscopicus]|uniref:hypothetical protein n=1 Tax=Streptomyces hygroscopicus TaxID=1912 RepID=UPI00378BB364
MAKSDEELLDFDKMRLADWSAKRAQEALNGENADLYRNHLAIALWIDGWAERLGANDVQDPKYNAGYIKGIREIAAHLRQTDLLPGGALLADLDL